MADGLIPDDLVREAKRQFGLFQNQCAERGVDSQREMMRRAAAFEAECASQGLDPVRAARALALADQGRCMCCGAKLPKGVDPIEAYKGVFGDE